MRPPLESGGATTLEDERPTLEALVFTTTRMGQVRPDIFPPSFPSPHPQWPHTRWPHLLVQNREVTSPNPGSGPEPALSMAVPEQGFTCLAVSSCWKALGPWLHLGLEVGKWKNSIPKDTAASQACPSRAFTHHTRAAGNNTLSWPFSSFPLFCLQSSSRVIPSTLPSPKVGDYMDSLQGGVSGGPQRPPHCLGTTSHHP